MSEQIDRHKRWRLENPDKVRAQRERRKARQRGDAPPYVKPPKTPEEDQREKQRNRTRCWYLAKRAKMAKDPEFAEKHRAAERARAMRHLEKLRADPEAYAAYLKKLRDRKRAEKGIPLDAPVKPARLSDEERTARKRARAAASREQKRKAYRLAHGIPIDAPVKAARLSDEERAERKRARAAANREQKRRSYRLAHGIQLDAPPRNVVNKREAEKRRKAKERADRSAMIAEIMARPVVKESLTTAVCPDPPELQELFRKAAKGDPVRPIHRGKKKSVFQLRGLY